MPTLDAADFVRERWSDVMAQLPADIEAIAAEHGVLKYRRAFASVSALLRVAFGYSVLDLSLRSAAGWAASAGVCARISDVGLMKQLQGMSGFVGALVQRMIDPANRMVPRGLTLVDGTSISVQGSDGADWRVNLAYSGGAGRSVGVRLTEASVGEHLEASRLRPGDVAVCDRHYCKQGVLAGLSEAGCDFVVRGTRSFRVRGADRVSRPLEHWLVDSRLEPGQFGEHQVFPAAAGSTAPLRLIVIRRTEVAAERAAAALVRAANRKQKPGAASAAALRAAGYVFLLTSLPVERATAEEVAEAYRFRWQVELTFKRWKSLLALGDLRARGRLAETYILCKLLAALLIEATLSRVGFSPWGTGAVRAIAREGAPRAHRRPRARRA